MISFRLLILLYTTLLMIGGCGNSKETNDKVMPEENKHKYTNNLINETSPYLLQHAHNPVNWQAWGDAAFDQAKKENKLVLVSIGYSACHWCHVMEHESFENEEVASYMNEHFVCIKVDREERPDVDQIYMSAVQMMTGQGGWPLNCFTLPDGRPIYGGTYFRKQEWMDILQNLEKVNREQNDKVVEYAEKVTSGIKQQEHIIKTDTLTEWDPKVLEDMVGKWQTLFDTKEGGMNRAPKFPMPNNLSYLLRYSQLFENKVVADYAHLTLEKMAYGGIYDQIGGGFARYSVDSYWKVPHFEKMLYDNAQLLSAYATAYRQTKNPLYKSIIEQTVTYIEREMTGSYNQFYSALDADSEGEEGKYYVWQADEIKAILGDDYELAKAYYNINNKGLWEHGNYILLREESDVDLAKKFDMTEAGLSERVHHIDDMLLKKREERIKPGLDDKTLTSWNALMVTGLVDGFRAINDVKMLRMAQSNMEFLLKNQLREDGGLNHNFKNGKSNINGYLEDYCFTIQALLHLYQADLHEDWLLKAKALCDYTLAHFYNEKTGFFNFNSNEDPPLISTPVEVQDNVIPSSNSEMAKNLYLLAMIFDESNYEEISDALLSTMYDAMPSYGSGFSNWGILALWKVKPFKQVVITGKNFEELHEELYHKNLNNIFFFGAQSKSKLPLLEGKFFDGEGTIFVCENRTCQEPVNTVEAALDQLK